MFGWDFDGMERRRVEHEKALAAEYERLAQEPERLTMDVVPGSRVLIHAGLVSRGHMHKVIEATVIEANDRAAHVEYPRESWQKKDEPPTREWVRLPVILEVLPAREEEAEGD